MAFALPSEMVSVEFPPLPDGILGRPEICLEVEGTFLPAWRRARWVGGGAPVGGEPPGGRRLTCIVCPASCRVRVTDSGGQAKVTGAACEKGRSYALQEYRDPRRVFTYTVALSGGDAARLSARSSRPIRKADWRRAAEAAASIVVRAPVRCGQVLASDFLERGIDLIATRSAEASHGTRR